MGIALPSIQELSARVTAGALAGLNRGRWIIGSAAAAGLYTLACPPYQWPALAWAIPGVLLISLRGARPWRAFGCGVLFGVLSCAGVTGWAVHASLEYFAFNGWAARGFVLLVWLVYAGVPFGLFAAAYGSLAGRVPGAWRAVIAAWLWTSSEVLRAGGAFGGMPWELLGHTQFGAVTLIQIADLGGVYAVSFLIVLVSTGVAELLVALYERDGAPRQLRRYLALPAGALAATLAYGLACRHHYEQLPGREPLKVAIVQASIPNSFRWKREYFARNIAIYAQLTAAAEPFHPDLIVWPENAVNFYVDREPLLLAQLRDVAGLARDGLVLGAPRLEDARTAHNSAYLISRDRGVEAVYDKRQLVPFAEYNPLRSPPATDLKYMPGTRADPLPMAHAHLGTVICYEVLFPGLVSELVRNGADLLVNLSNDSWLDSGDGAAPQQHFSMAIFRSIETRRYLLRASANGVSGFVDPSGRPFAMLSTDGAGTTMNVVTPLSERTLYVAWGDSWILVVGLLLAVSVAWKLSRPTP